MTGLPEGVTPGHTMGDPPRWRPGDGPIPPHFPPPQQPERERESVTLNGVKPKGR